MPLPLVFEKFGNSQKGKMDAETLHCAWVGINYMGERQAEESEEKVACPLFLPFPSQTIRSFNMKEINTSKFVVMVVILAVLIGCAAIAPHQTIEELFTLREKRLEAATHKFNDTKRQDVEKAIVKVFNLLDRDDVKFDLRTNKILVSRWWTFYAVFVVGFGKDFWEFEIKEVGDGIEVTAAFDIESNQGPFATQVSTQFKENIGIGGNPTVGASIADYDLLYGRVEYILGTNKTWPTCDDIATKHNVGKNTMVLCGGIGIDDKRPE